MTLFSFGRWVRRESVGINLDQKSNKAQGHALRVLRSKIAMITTLLNNRYKTIQMLGAGGFGETFLAEDTYMPSQRRCVIKQLKPVTNDPQIYQPVQQRFQRDRFQREAAVLENLGESSDQIPKLYAYFCENGQFYLVQEWIQGQTLTGIVEAEGPLSETAVRDILISLLPVLDYVHSEGVIHGDIKPDNIILRQSNRKPVLIDFGAVKETIATGVNFHGKTTHSIVLGTPGFMSPEQATGRPIYASDIYSLGMTVIYLLTGKLPQELEIDPETDEMLWQQHALNVSPSLAAVLSKAIQYHPRDHYTTARKMLDALHNSASISPPQSSTQATVVLSPVAGISSQPPPVPSPQTAPMISQPSSLGNWQKAVILGSLIGGGLIGAALVVSLFHNQPPQSSIGTLPPPQSSPEQPVTRPASSPVSPAPAEAPPAPVTAQAPSPPPVSAQQQQKKPRNNSVGTATTSVPGFPVGTPQSAVEVALGKPNNKSIGYWKTRAVSYNNFVPNQIDLGYLYDPASGLIRETEAAFTQSVDPQVMLTTLDGMLGGGATEEIKRGLLLVQQRRANHYSFTKGSFRGIIVRQYCGLIYVGIWDADLHDFDVAGSRRC